MLERYARTEIGTKHVKANCKQNIFKAAILLSKGIVTK